MRERDTSKVAGHATAIAAALETRGVNRLAASLAAETGAAVLRVALAQWTADDDERDLATIVGDAFVELRAVATADLNGVFDSQTSDG